MYTPHHLYPCVHQWTFGLALVNNIAVNTGVSVISVFLCEIPGLNGNSILNFFEASPWFSMVAAPLIFPQQCTRDHHCWGAFPPLSLLTTLMLAFYPLLWRLSSFNPQASLRGNYSTCSCRFAMSLGGNGFRIFLHCHL